MEPDENICLILIKDTMDPHYIKVFVYIVIEIVCSLT